MVKYFYKVFRLLFKIYVSTAQLGSWLLNLTSKHSVPWVGGCNQKMGDSGFPNNNNREGLKLQHCVINRFLFPDVEAPAQVFVVVSLTEVN